jgi:hypothetical protein
VPIAVAFRSGHLEAAESIILAMELAGVLFASMMFAFQDRYAPCVSHVIRLPESLGWLLSFLLVASIVVVFIVMFWFVVGSTLLEVGLRVGSLMPVLATSAEALIKAGEHVTDPIRRGLKWLSLGSACLIVAALLTGSGQAIAAETPSATQSKEPPGRFQRSWSAFNELSTGSPEARSVQQGVGVRNRRDSHGRSLCRPR